MVESRSLLLTPALALLLAGCASYAPRPLAANPPDADLAVLTRDASTIDRPYLKPASINLSAPLDDNAIAVIAVLNNPDLKAQRAKSGIADAQAFAARLLPDPTFNVGFAPHLMGEDPVGEITSALGLDIATLRTAKVTRQQSAAQAKQVRLDMAWAEWQTAGQAQLQAVRILHLEKGVSLLRANAAGAQSLLDRNLRAAGRGDVAATAVQASRSDALASQDKVRTSEHDLDAAKLELVKLLGLSPGTPLALAPLTDSGAVVDAGHLTDVAIANRSDLQALRSGYDAQEASVHKAILNQFPTLALNFNFTRDSARNIVAGPAVDFTLPLWNRNRGNIAIEKATRESLKAEYEARLFQTRADIAAAVSAIALARTQRDAIRANLPHLEQIAAASRHAADRGDLALATAQAAEGAVGDQRAALATAEQTIDEAMIALELLTGVPKEDWR